MEKFNKKFESGQTVISTNPSNKVKYKVLAYTTRNFLVLEAPAGNIIKEHQHNFTLAPIEVKRYGVYSYGLNAVVQSSSDKAEMEKMAKKCPNWIVVELTGSVPALP